MAPSSPTFAELWMTSTPVIPRIVFEASDTALRTAAEKDSDDTPTSSMILMTPSATGRSLPFACRRGRLPGAAVRLPDLWRLAIDRVEQAGAEPRVRRRL